MYVMKKVIVPWIVRAAINNAQSSIISSCIETNMYT